MCGRYACELTDQELFDMFRLPAGEFLPKERFDVRPGTKVPTIRLGKNGGREMVGLDWMWVHEKFRHPNAKGENVRRYPAYRESFAHRRCLVPATGYYEWKLIQKPHKQRYYIERKDGKPMAFAGLFSVDDGMMATITMPPNAEISAVHDRVPIFIEEADWERYLDPEPLTDEEKRRMIATPPDDFFRYWPVANNAVGPDLLKEVPPMIIPTADAPLPRRPTKRPPVSDSAQGDLFG